MQLKRDEIKYIRDISKSAYSKASNCYICETTENLEFHHFYSLSLLWAKWKKKNKIVINSVEDILEHREVFRDLHKKEIYEETVTLCKVCHSSRLHKTYGKVPPLHTSEKQKRWVQRQKDKHLNKSEKV